MHDGTTPLGPRRGLRWFAAGAAGLSGFFALEALVRSPREASDLHPGTEDASSTGGVAVATALAALSAPFLRRLPLRPLPRWCAPLGLLVLGAGLALRVWSMQTLAESYSRTLRVTNEQQVIERGPYRRVRHPGYAGSLLVWSGFGLSSGSAAVLGTVASLLLPVYIHRMEAEERLLTRQLPGYAAYAERTTRLVPHVW
jgi:protein-S-isoprenylcysteine O-methyltransferase